MFFTAINQMMTEGVDLTLVIRKANGQMAVSVLPKSNGLKDEAQNHIIPLTLKGVPQELDTGFLQAVARPVQKATGLITNMAQFEAQTEKAASESKAAKDAKAKETKEEKEKREKYEKHLKKAEELIAAGNHKDAVTALGQARLYAKPQDQKKIDEMLEQQKKAMNRGSLFELMEEPPAPQQLRSQPPAATAQQLQPAPHCPPQSQASGPAGGQIPDGQQQTMWPPQQPAQRPAPHQAPPQPQYAGQRPMSRQLPPQPAYAEQQISYRQEQEQNPEDLYPYYQRGQEVPTYRPEDYEEYTRFASRLHEPRPMAEFKGGREAMIRFFEQNLRYPESYKGTGTKVRLFYSFTIDSLGMLQNPISLPENILYPRNTGKTYDEFRDEALRVLQLMPAWEPAVNRIHGPASIDTGLFFYFNEEGKCGIE